MSPKNDFAFRLLFGDERFDELLISLLSAILGQHIDQVTIKSPHLLPMFYKDKEGILDVKAVIDGRALVDIEMQLNECPEMMNRILLYWSKLYSSQIREGDDYDLLEKTISILIMDYISLPSDEMQTCFQLRECQQKLDLTDMIEVHTIELPKLHKQGRRDTNTEQIQWMTFLNAESIEELKMASEANPVIKKATDLLITMSQDEETRQIYEAREQYLLDQKLRMAAMRRKGIAEGIEKGREEGREEGREIEKHNVARILVAAGMDNEFISTVTGLPPEEISKIRMI